MSEWRRDAELALERLRAWIDETATEIEADTATVESEQRAAPAGSGLSLLAESFTALRHEVKLQTKGARGLEQGLGEALQGLGRAEQLALALLERLQEQTDAEPTGRGGAESGDSSRGAAERPLIETLCDVDESLRRGSRAVESLVERVATRARHDAQRLVSAEWSRGSAWRRWWLGDSEPLTRALADALAAGAAAELGSLREGWQIMLARLERALDAHDVERLPCLGQPVDPHRMTVIEVVRGPEHATPRVVEELRPGYLWRGQLLRFAEVRVGAPPEARDE